MKPADLIAKLNKQMPNVSGAYWFRTREILKCELPNIAKMSEDFSVMIGILTI